MSFHLLSRFLGCLILVLSLLTVPVYAQEDHPLQAGKNSVKGFPDPMVHLKIQSLKTFDSLFNTISEQGHVAFVAEGSPLHTTLSEKTHQKLMQGIPSEGIALHDAVSQVAKAFGYDAVRKDATTFLLYKDYLDPNDLPFVTLDEAIQSLTNILRATDPVNPHAPEYYEKDNLPERVLKSLSPEQVARVSSQAGLPVTSLPDHLRKMVWTIAVQNYVQSRMDEIDRFLGFMKAIRDKRSVFRYMEVMDTKVPVFVCDYPYPYPIGHAVGTGQVVLSHGFLGLPDAGNVLAEGGSNPIIMGAINVLPSNMKVMDAVRPNLIKQMADRNPPTSEELAPREMPQSAGTLLSTVQRLNIRHESSGRIDASVDEKVGAKPICVVGMQFSSPTALLNAMAQVYGLKVLWKGEDKFFLTLRPFTRVRDLHEVQKAIYGSFPEPWYRAMKGGIPREADILSASEEKERAILQKYGMRKPIDRFTPLYRTADNLHKSLARRLRVLTEPLVKAKGAPVSVLESGAEAMSLLAFNCMITYLKLDMGYDHDDKLEQLPDYLEDFNHTTLSGSITKYPNATDKSREWINFYLNYPVQNGNNLPQVSISFSRG